MTNIKINDLTFGYEDAFSNIFNNLNLDIDSSWKLGLVGRNGRGKTTFLNLLSGNLKGLGEITSNLDFTYFPLRVDNPENITLYELQNKVYFEQWKLERELSRMKMSENLLWQPFNTLSGGEQTKVLLALLFTIDNAFSLIDEPTNHLDESSRLQISEYLKKQSKGYILVSHDRDFLNQVTDHILAIENTEIHLYHGNYASYEDTKEKRDDFNRQKNQKISREVQRLNDALQKNLMFANRSESQKNSGRKYKGKVNHRAFHSMEFDVTKIAANNMRRAKNIERRLNNNVNEKRGLLVNIEKVPDLTMNFQKNYHQTLLEVKDLSLNIDDRTLFSNLDLLVKNQGIVSLEGENGTGKSSFLRYLLGNAKNISTFGKSELTNGLKISYLPQNFTEYTGTLSKFAQNNRLSYEGLLNTLSRMGFAKEVFKTPIEEMSVGQQKRVALAKSLIEPADIYFWDEPANYLDVFNQDQLIHLLQTVKPAMLLVEHDQYFIKQVVQKRIFL